MTTTWLVLEFDSDRSLGLVPAKDVVPGSTIEIGAKVEIYWGKARKRFLGMLHDVCDSHKEAEDSLKKFRKSKKAWRNFLQSQTENTPTEGTQPTTSGAPDVPNMKRRMEELEEKNSEHDYFTSVYL